MEKIITRRFAAGACWRETRTEHPDAFGGAARGPSSTFCNSGLLLFVAEFFAKS
jgi:hypothetical protein